MSDLRAAAQQALEALEDHAKQYPHMQKGYTVDAITALRAALAEPVQEPYCFVYEYDGVFGLHMEFFPRTYNGMKPSRTVPVYTAPPQRKPLTEEEILEAVRDADLDWQAGWTLDEHEPNRFTTLARAVEQAHGIKE